MLVDERKLLVSVLLLAGFAAQGCSDVRTAQLSDCPYLEDVFGNLYQDKKCLDRVRERVESGKSRERQRAAEADQRNWKAKNRSQWRDERAAAAQQAKLPSGGSPLAWLNGVWCDRPDAYRSRSYTAHRFQIMDGNGIRVVETAFSTNVYNQHEQAFLNEKRGTVTAEAGYYELRVSGLSKYDKGEQRSRIRKMSNDQYVQEKIRTIYPDPSKNRAYKYKRFFYRCS